MSAQTVYLVSGANRGIGFSIVETLAKRENVLIYAGARDPSKATQLNEFAKQSNNKVRVIKLVSADSEGNRAAAAEIEKEVGHLDVVIANAGISSMNGFVENAPIESVQEHFTVNTVGPLVLFQATIDLLRHSKQPPKFAVVSTLAGSITLLSQGISALPLAAYMTSKAAVNSLFARAHFEHEKDGLVTFVLHPGMLETDMGKSAIEKIGAALVPDNYEDSIAKIVALVDKATREETGGKFINAVTGEDAPW